MKLYLNNKLQEINLDDIENGIENNNKEIENLKTRFNNEKIYNIKDYGAVGDGSVIENTAIQSILDKALIENGITVYFPVGIYKINGPLEVFSNTHLILDDNAIITRQLHGALLMNGEYKGSVQYSNIHIEGGIWDMDNDDSSYSGSVHFVLGNADNILIENCKFLNNHGNHALDIAGCENVTIRDCQFIGQWADSDTTRYYVEAVQIAEFTQAGQPSWGGGWNNRPCKNVLVDNCIFDKNFNNDLYTGYGAAIGNHSSYEYFGSSNIRIMNCTINNCYFGIRPCNWSDVVIENCTINNCNQGIHLTSCGKSEDMPDKHSPLTNTVINNCTIANSIAYDIWGKGKFAYNNPEDISYLDGLIINNCKFKGCNGEDSSSSIYLDVCKNIRINHNTIENSVRNIWLSSCKDVVINENICDVVKNEGVYLSKTTQVEDVYKPTLGNIKVINNTFRDCGRNGMYIQFANDFIISNNTVTNCALDDDYTRNGILIDTANRGIIVNNIVQGESHYKDIKITLNSSNVTCKDNIAETIENE